MSDQLPRLPQGNESRSIAPYCGTENQALPFAERYDISRAMDGADGLTTAQGLAAASKDALGAIGNLAGNETGQRIAGTAADFAEIGAAAAAGTTTPVAQKYDVLGAAKGADAYNLVQGAGAAARASLGAAGNLVGNETGQKIGETAADVAEIAGAFAAGTNAPVAQNYDVVGAVKGADGTMILGGIEAAARHSLGAAGDLVGDSPGKQIGYTVADGVDIAAARLAGTTSPYEQKYNVVDAVQSSDGDAILQGFAAAAQSVVNATGEMLGSGTGKAIAGSILGGIDHAAKLAAQTYYDITDGNQSQSTPETSEMSVQAKPDGDIQISASEVQVDDSNASVITVPLTQDVSFQTPGPTVFAATADTLETAADAAVQDESPVVNANPTTTSGSENDSAPVETSTGRQPPAAETGGAAALDNDPVPNSSDTAASVGGSAEGDAAHRDMGLLRTADLDGNAPLEPAETAATAAPFLASPGGADNGNAPFKHGAREKKISSEWNDLIGLDENLRMKVNKPDESALDEAAKKFVIQPDQSPSNSQATDGSGIWSLQDIMRPEQPDDMSPPEDLQQLLAGIDDRGLAEDLSELLPNDLVPALGPDPYDTGQDRSTQTPGTPSLDFGDAELTNSLQNLPHSDVIEELYIAADIEYAAQRTDDGGFTSSTSTSFFDFGSADLADALAGIPPADIAAAIGWNPSDGDGFAASAQTGTSTQPVDAASLADGLDDVPDAALSNALGNWASDPGQSFSWDAGASSPGDDGGFGGAVTSALSTIADSVDEGHNPYEDGATIGGPS